LRLLFEEPDGPEVAPKAAAAAHPSSGAALRAEARRRRKLDMRERLAGMIRPDGSVAGGIVKFINLYPIAAAVGDRWPIAFPKVEMMSESIIRREVTERDLWAVHGDQGFAVIFTDPELTDEEADLRCLRIFEAIREHLLGKVPVARPRFDVDPRILLRAFDENGTPPLVMTNPTQPPGAWVPPATALAERAAYLPPGTETKPIGGAGWEPPASDAPPIAWSPIEPPARDIAVGRSDDRTDIPFDVQRSDERVAATLEVGRSETRPKAGFAIAHSDDRPTSDGAVARSDDKPKAEIDWHYETEEERLATIQAWDGRYRDPEEFDPRSRDKRSHELVLLEGESREQAIARYVTMGRFNTMFDAIGVRFRSFWAHRQQAVALYRADARLRADDLDVGSEILIERADAVAALAALDIAVLARTIEAVVPRIQAGGRFFFVVPVSFDTLLRRTDRHAFFDQWATVPETIRQFGRFACYQSTAEIGDAALGEIIGMLSRAGRSPIFASPLASGGLDRLRDLRVKAISLDGSTFETNPNALETARKVATIAQRLGIVTYVEGAPVAVRRRLLDTDANFIEGALLPDAAALPARPVTVSAEAFAAGG
jgi:hypothetical protein